MQQPEEGLTLVIPEQVLVTVFEIYGLYSIQDTYHSCVTQQPSLCLILDPYTHTHTLSPIFVYWDLCDTAPAG